MMRAAAFRDDPLRAAATAAGLAGLAIATYLTIVHYAGGTPACGIAHGCATVQASEWATLAGVPVALLGALGYLAIVVSLWVPGEAARLTGAILAIGGLGFSAYLTYRELFDIHAICQWCVSSAVLMTALAATCVTRTLRAPTTGRPARPAR
jgi:uncharacterized membrane protein